MAVSVQEGPLVAQGYPYTLRIEADLPLFSAAHAYKVQARAKPSASAVLAEITSASGVVFVSENAIELTFPGTATASFPLGEVWFDMIRTDVTPNLFMGFQVAVAVIQPVTRS